MGDRRARATRFGGRQAVATGIFRASATVLNGGKTLLDKFPWRGPVLSSTDYGGVEGYYDPSGWGMS